MKKSIRIIGTIATMGAIAFGSYLLGTRQAETVTEIQTITEIKEVVPDGYIPLDDSIVDMDTVVGFTASEDGLQLYFEDGTGLWLER